MEASNVSAIGLRLEIDQSTEINFSTHLGMLNYLDANDCFRMISFEFESLSHNFYSTAKLENFGQTLLGLTTDLETRKTQENLNFCEN